MYKLLLKAIIDKLVSILGMIILSPMLILLSVWVKLDSNGPILFRQKRIGIHKTHFLILKFRTMRVNAPKDCPTHLLGSPDQYITGAGRFLRKTSLDELPQILNIVRGDMSIIGPRPALWNQYDLIAERDKYHANDIMPGLTGWAQINGRDELAIEEKARLDGEYVKKMGLCFDLKIFFRTISSVFRSEGIKEGASISRKDAPL